MDGCINSILKRIKFLNHKESLKNRIETEEYFCQPFVAQHLHWFDFFVLFEVAPFNKFKR